MSNGEGRFSISVEGERLVFRTERFAADKGSVLHSGIFNREFASALTAFGIAGLAYLAVGLRYGKTFLTHAIVFGIFAAGFVLLRILVFKERYLTAEFDRRAAAVRITETGFLRGRTEVVQLNTVERLRIDRKELGVANPDGAAFVEKISAQHGMVIPGFGEEEVYYILQLVLSGGATRTLYADKGEGKALAAYDEISAFLGKIS